MIATLNSQSSVFWFVSPGLTYIFYFFTIFPPVIFCYPLNHQLERVSYLYLIFFLNQLELLKSCNIYLSFLGESIQQTLLGRKNS